MKLKISTPNFRAVTSHAYGAVKASTTLPILGNLLLVAKDGKLTATGCNLDLWAQTSVPCEIFEEGAVTLNARKLVGIGKTVSADTISLDVDDQLNATIRSGQSKSVIPGLRHDDFPPIMEGTGAKKEWTISADRLRSILTRISPSQSSDAARYVLNGVLLEASNGKANWVAGNGRVLSFVAESLEGPDENTIMPSDFVTQAIRLLDAEGMATLHIHANCVKLTVGDSLIASKLIEGSYPNYKQILPSDFAGSAEIDRAQFISELARVAEVGTTAAGECWPFLTFSKNDLSIMADAGGSHVSETSMPVKTGDDLRIRLDKKFLDAALRSLPDDSFRLEWTDCRSAIAIRAGNFTSIIMPMRTAPANEN